jgi:hypothetical protein
VAPDRGLFAVDGAFEALHELLKDTARVDQLPYVPTVGPAVLFAQKRNLDGPLVPSVIGVASEEKKRIPTSSGSAPARTWAPAEDLPASTSWQTTPAWAALRSLMLIPVPRSAAAPERLSYTCSRLSIRGTPPLAAALDP